MSDTALSVRDLSYTYPGHLVPTLRGIAFDLPRGSLSALLGPNGSGKTTLMKCCAGLLRHSGEAWVGGERAKATAPLRGDKELHRASRVVYVPQGHRVFPGLSVGENLLVGGHLLHGKGIHLRVEEVLDAFPRLRPLLPKVSGLLSGGEQQETVLARAMMLNPELLLIDEPLLGLDKNAVERVREAVLLLHGQNRTLCIAEHRLVEAVLPLTHRLTLDAGRIASFETVALAAPPIADATPVRGRGEGRQVLP